MPEKVVITGMNIISSLGLDLQTNWDNLRQGKSGVKYITLFDASSKQTRIAAEVPPGFEEFSRSYVKKRQAGQMTRMTRMCLVCARGAVNAAGIDFDRLDRSRCA